MFMRFSRAALNALVAGFAGRLDGTLDTLLTTDLRDVWLGDRLRDFELTGDLLPVEECGLDERPR